MSLILQLAPKDLAFLVKIFEGYEGLAMVKTLDGKQGVVEMLYPADTESEVRLVLETFPRPFREYKTPFFLQDPDKIS